MRLVENPGLVNVMLYVPDGTLTKIYSPESLVEVVKTCLVDTSVSLTSVPPMTACCGSVTSPATVVVCAKACMPNRQSNANTDKIDEIFQDLRPIQPSPLNWRTSSSLRRRNPA